MKATDLERSRICTFERGAAVRMQYETEHGISCFKVDLLYGFRGDADKAYKKYNVQ